MAKTPTAQIEITVDGWMAWRRLVDGVDYCDEEARSRIQKGPGYVPRLTMIIQAEALRVRTEGRVDIEEARDAGAQHRGPEVMAPGRPGRSDNLSCPVSPVDNG